MIIERGQIHTYKGNKVAALFSAQNPNLEYYFKELLLHNWHTTQQIQCNLTFFRCIHATKPYFNHEKAYKSSSLNNFNKSCRPQWNTPVFEIQECFTSRSPSSGAAAHHLGQQELGGFLSNVVSLAYILLPAQMEFLSSQIYFLVCLFFYPVGLYIKVKM